MLLANGSVDHVSQSGGAGDGAHGSATSDVVSAPRGSEGAAVLRRTMSCYCHTWTVMVHKNDVFPPEGVLRKMTYLDTRCSMVAPSGCRQSLVRLRVMGTVRESFRRRWRASPMGFRSVSS